MMDKHAADKAAEELARITSFRPGTNSRGNEEALLAWLEERDRQGWVVAYASACVPGQGSTVVWGMMTKQGTWERQSTGADAASWNGCDEGWCYGAQGLRPYGMEWGNEALEDAYAITYRRRATCRTGDEDYTEIDQRMTLPEGVHWYPEYRSWGRWSGDTGRIEPLIIEGTYAEAGGTQSRIVVVSNVLVRSQYTQGGLELVQFLDGTWASEMAFAGWTTAGEDLVEQEQMVYRRSAKHERWAYIRGARRVEVDSMEDEGEGEVPREEEIEFICWPYLPDGDKNRRPRRSRVTREALRSYFDQPDERCLEITPAFFHPEVLSKYLGDPERYEVEERQIRAREAWELKTYDINEEGQVHTYLVDLGQLPLKEQLHWKAYNEEPRGKIAERAYRMDIEGELGPDTPTNRLRRFAERQQRQNSAWWTTHNEQAVERYLPCTNGDALTLWKESVGKLHQCTVENLTTKYFREGEDKSGKSGERGPLAALRGWLHRQRVDQGKRNTILEPLDELNHIRNTAVAHGRRPEAGEKEIAKAKGFPLRLRGHSLDLTKRVTEALEALEEVVTEVERRGQGDD